MNAQDRTSPISATGNGTEANASRPVLQACPKCHAEIHAAGRFCSWCAAELPAAQGAKQDAADYSQLAPTMPSASAPPSPAVKGGPPPASGLSNVQQRALNQHLLEEYTRQYKQFVWKEHLSHALPFVRFDYTPGKVHLKAKVGELGIDSESWARSMEAYDGKTMWLILLLMLVGFIMYGLAYRMGIWK